MSPHSISETIETQGCRVVLRRVSGCDPQELFVHGRPLDETADAGKQAESIYRAFLEVLNAEGGSFDSVVSESLFMRDLGEKLAPIRESRRRVLSLAGAPFDRPATTEIEQPPLDEGAGLEVSLHALLSSGPLLASERVEAPTTCGCDECARAHGLRVQLGDEARLYAGGLCGAGQGAYEQTLDMFSVAEALLGRAGMDFHDVARTWIHIRDIERDYDALNRARREFFESRGIDPVPASTGIGGGPTSPAHALCLGVYALKTGRPPVRTVMTSPTLNEAGTYGADFVRGLRMVESNKVALHVSGTASIDERGRTAHPEDFDAQADRMLLNVKALLEGQGATLEDVVSAVTYLKRPEDADRLREKLHAAGFAGFPNALVAAQVCRPDLLCETEVLAVLPAPRA